MVVAGEIIIGLSCLFATIVCGIRFYLRGIVTKQHPWNELPLVLALCCLIITLGIQIKMFEMLPYMENPQTAVLFFKLVIVVGYLYSTTLYAVKLSVNLLHIRLTERIPAVHVWAVRSVYAIIALYFINLINYIAACYPVSRRWNGPIGNAKACTTMVKEWAWWVFIVIHVLSDIWLCILPFAALRELKEKRLRIAVFGVYSLAFAAILITIIRAIFLAIDPQRNMQVIMTISTVELAITVIIGAIPCISSVFTTKYLGRSLGTHPSRREDALQSYRSQNFSRLQENGSSQSAKKNSFELSESVDRNGSRTGWT